jgi:tRNA-splicing ligase RtcB
LPTRRREESWLGRDEPLGKLYWAHHNSAAKYAIANRQLVVHGIREATQGVFGADVEVYFEISHNLVQEETLVLPDGTARRGSVHRKGATRAFPAGHPDLAGTPWATTGHPCLIPGSMLDGAAILFPAPGAYRAGCSVNHGSGRHMARGAARRELAAIHDEIDHEMATIERTLGGLTITGVVGNSERKPLDECAHVYENPDEILAVLEGEGIARVAHRLYPVANIKGTD